MQTEIVNIDEIIPLNHPYRKIKNSLDLKHLSDVLCIRPTMHEFEGYGDERLLLGLVLRHIEGLSLRALDRFIAENTAAKWFCEFCINEKTPDYSTFSKFVDKIGMNKISEMIDDLKYQLNGMLPESSDKRYPSFRGDKIKF